jgi:hypothetical protein
MLLKNITEIREVLKIGSSVDFDVLKPVIETVELNYIRKVLGAEIYDVLQAYYDAGAPPINIEKPEGVLLRNPQLNKLLKLAQSCEVHLAYWFGFDLLNVQILNDGFKRTETEKVKGLFKYQEDNLKDFFKHAGFNGLDTMLEYMDGPDKEMFPEFHQSTAALALKEMFIPRTDIFDQYYSLGNSRLIFNRLKPHMKTIEDLRIKIVLGELNYAFIKAEMVKAEPDARVTAILPHIARPIVFLSTALLMEETASDLSDKGLVFESITSNSTDHSNRGPAGEPRIAAMIKRNQNLGESYMVLLRNYLLDNASEWNNYTQPRRGLPNRDNTGKKTFWA